MFTNQMPKIFVVLLVIAIVLVTASFASRSVTLPAADRSYDSIEQVRALPDSASGYDQVEALRIQRANPMPAASAYDLVEQVRLGRALNADHSYDKIEALRQGR